jgi:beta-lactamase class A
MRAEINQIIQKHPEATIAIAFYDCETGAECLIRPDERFHPASTFKIAVMIEIFHQVQEGVLSLEEPVRIVNEFTSIADSSLFSMLVEDDSEATLYQRIGQTASLRELIWLMITQSSNLATNLLIQRVTAKRVTEYMHELGAPDIQVLRGPEDNRAYALGMNNTATASGLMLLLHALVEGKVVSFQASTEMIQILLNQNFNEGIPAGLPEGIRVAHKTGWNPQLYHDAAIVFPANRKPYCLVVMTRGIQEDQDAHELVAEISNLCYNRIMQA